MQNKPIRNRVLAEAGLAPAILDWYSDCRWWVFGMCKIIAVECINIFAGIAAIEMSVLIRSFINSNL